MPKIPTGLLKRLAGMAKGFARGVKKFGPKGQTVQKAIPKSHKGKKQMFRGLFKDPLGTMKRSFAPKKFMAISRGMATSPLKTVKKGWKSKKFSKGEALLMGSLVPGEMKRIQDSGESGGPSKAEVAGSVAGDLAGWAAFSRLPLLGQMAGWTLGGYAGRAAGKAVHGLSQAGRKAGKSMAEKMEKKSSLIDYTRAYVKALEGDTDE